MIFADFLKNRVSSGAWIKPSEGGLFGSKRNIKHVHKAFMTNPFGFSCSQIEINLFHRKIPRKKNIKETEPFAFSQM